MLRTITPDEMRRVETRVMRNTTLSGERLMQNAAAHVARAVERLSAGRQGPVVCFCGNGNNGGDGLAAMRMLAEGNPAFQGECRLLSGTLSPDAQRERDRLNERAPRVAVTGPEAHAISKPACVIDALFGTGLSRPLEGEALAACRRINAWQEQGVPVVAVDIPSGLSGLTGDVLGEAVRATVTVTFHRPKPGLYLKDGPDYTGEIVVADIGLTDPEAAAYDDAGGLFVWQRSDPLLPARRRGAHKGCFGKVLLWVGSRGMAGAAAICATAALRTGAGLVMVACPEAVVDVVQTLCPCATCLPLPEEADAAWALLEDRLSWADALGAGCGLGTGAWAKALLERLCAWLDGHALPAVLDADALNLLSASGQRPRGVWITPHPAEAARLLGQATAEALADPLATARELARRYGPTVLKGACSVLCAGEEMAINPFGTPAMAKGGSGDALTGVLAALLAGRAAGAYTRADLPLLQTACALHGLAGEMAERRFGECGVLATDLCACLGLVESAPVEAPRDPQPSGPLGRWVTVTVEHPRGSVEDGPLRRRYPANFGYVQEVLADENEWQDACVLGIDDTVEWMEGKVSALATLEDGRRIWIVSPPGTHPGAEAVRQALSILGPVQEMDFPSN